MDSLHAVSPKASFYKSFTSAQILDIITNVDTYREIPRQYNYFEHGAEYWDKYTHRLASENTSNVLTSTIKLLELINNTWMRFSKDSNV